MPYKTKKAQREHAKAYYRTHRKHSLEVMKKYAKSPAGKEAKWRGNLKYHYKITFEDHEKMRHRQKNLCAFCGRPLPKTSHAPVDHNHKTKKVRALVHARCNLIIGTVEKWMPFVNIYLQKWEGQ